MTETITAVKKSRKFKLPSKKTLYKVAALTIVGGCVVLVGYDKLTHSNPETDHVVETPES